MVAIAVNSAPGPCIPCPSAFLVENAQRHERLPRGSITAARFAAGQAGLADLVRLQDAPIAPRDLLRDHDGPRSIEAPSPHPNGTPPFPRTLDHQLVVPQVDPLVAWTRREDRNAQGVVLDSHREPS